ncbi:MAG: hypothetical protein LBT46_08950 [Planctomycetaceae bacterium]|jgi:hypothetical protein|nr:hypothetical protein [Planctomycetaceae bacterium]
MNTANHKSGGFDEALFDKAFENFDEIFADFDEHFSDNYNGVDCPSEHQTDVSEPKYYYAGLFGDVHEVNPNTLYWKFMMAFWHLMFLAFVIALIPFCLYWGAIILFVLAVCIAALFI